LSQARGFTYLLVKTESDAQKAAKQQLGEDSHDTQYSRMEVAKSAIEEKAAAVVDLRSEQKTSQRILALRPEVSSHKGIANRK
jgi:hypothetical protein